MFCFKHSLFLEVAFFPQTTRKRHARVDDALSLRLCSQLEETKIKIKEQNRVQVASFGNKFGKSAGDLVAQELGKKTVGLVTLEELRR
jgi:hypothetical protein